MDRKRVVVTNAVGITVTDAAGRTVSQIAVESPGYSLTDPARWRSAGHRVVPAPSLDELEAGELSAWDRTEDTEDEQ